jgi:hypothetical protein
MTEQLKLTDSVTFLELANLFHIPLEVVIAAIEAQRRNFNKPFYTVQDLAVRWSCSRQNINYIIRKFDARTLNLGTGKRRRNLRVPAATVERIERQSMDHKP